jgi:hypothetical protein
MKRSQATCVFGALLICGMGLGVPGVAYAVTGCTNANLQGTYTAQVASANLMTVLNAISIPPGSNPFVNGPFVSLGSGPSTSPQFFLDGQGNMVAQNTAAAGTTVGTYNVNTDCSATISLINGATLNAVLVEGGAGLLFVQNNAASGGSVGALQRIGSGACLTDGTQPSLGFSFFGAQQNLSSTTPPTATFTPASGVGSLQLNGQGGFTLQEWVYQNGIITAATLSGTYTVAQDCSISLTVTPPSSTGGPTTAVTVPVTFQAGLVNGTGLLTVLPNAFTTINGNFFVQ